MWMLVIRRERRELGKGIKNTHANDGISRKRKSPY